MAGVLGACGKKGPLRLPEPAAPAAPASPDAPASPEAGSADEETE
jgi:predicted small lipoprotein YifL